MSNEVQFDIHSAVVIGDLTDVKEDKPVMEPARNVLVRIKDCAIIGKEPERWQGLQPTFVVEEGVICDDGQTRFKGFHLRGLICIYANPNAYEGDYAEKIKKRKHLVDLKYFLMALGMDTANVAINDEFLVELKGKQLYVNVLKTKNKDGDEENKVSGFKAVPADNLI